jgi:hypothetical protein
MNTVGAIAGSVFSRRYRQLIEPAMNPPLPRLEIIPTEWLLPHEFYDSQRTWPLVTRIRATGVFRSPPVVSPLPDGSQRCVVLDGANRTAALRAMGLPHALVQIVPPTDPDLRLRTWNHILMDFSLEALLKDLCRLPGLDLASSRDQYISLPGNRAVGLALIQDLDGEVYALSTPASDLEGRALALNIVVDTYKRLARLDRTSLGEIGPLRGLYPGLAGLVIFPKFNIADLLYLAGKGALLPPGITRTTIAPRCLDIKLPLAILAGKESLEEKNAILQALLAQRILSGRVEYCEGGAFIFDE